MVIEAIKENLCINKLIAEKREILLVEGDMIVPDSKPDILNTICTSGVVCVYKKEILDEKIRIDGGISTYIMYLADDEKSKIRGINTTIDFSETINVKGCKEGMDEKIDCKLKQIECKVINGRKIGIKATLEINIKIYSNENVEVVNEIKDAEDIKMLKENLSVNSLVGMGETKIYAKDTISVNQEDSIAEILKSNICICDKDIKISYNKILTKAEANVKLLYLTEDDKIKTINTKIPVVGFIDIANVKEENISDVNYEIKNLIIKMNPVEEHSIYVEIEILVKACVYEEKQINLIQDLYSPCENIEFEKKNVLTMTNKRNEREIKKISEKVQIEQTNNQKILDVDVIPIIEETKNFNNRITYNGNIELRFILEDENTQLDTKMAKIPFEHIIDNIQNADHMNSDLNIEVSNQDFIVQDGGIITSNIDLTMNQNSYQNISLSLLNEIQQNGEREEQDYSLIMYIVKKGDSLWKIAKTYGSTIDDIVRINGIEDENKINIGQKLFIPRYVKKGVSSQKTSMVNYV